MQDTNLALEKPINSSSKTATRKNFLLKLNPNIFIKDCQYIYFSSAAVNRHLDLKRGLINSVRDCIENEMLKQFCGFLAPLTKDGSDVPEEVSWVCANLRSK